MLSLHILCPAFLFPENYKWIVFSGAKFIFQSFWPEFFSSLCLKFKLVIVQASSEKSWYQIQWFLGDHWWKWEIATRSSNHRCIGCLRTRLHIFHSNFLCSKNLRSKKVDKINWKVDKIKSKFVRKQPMKNRMESCEYSYLSHFKYIVSGFDTWMWLEFSASFCQKIFFVKFFCQIFEQDFSSNTNFEKEYDLTWWLLAWQTVWNTHLNPKIFSYFCWNNTQIYWSDHSKKFLKSWQNKIKICEKTTHEKWGNFVYVFIFTTF